MNLIEKGLIYRIFSMGFLPSVSILVRCSIFFKTWSYHGVGCEPNITKLATVSTPRYN